MSPPYTRNPMIPEQISMPEDNRNLRPHRTPEHENCRVNCKSPGRRSPMPARTPPPCRRDRKTLPPRASTLREGPRHPISRSLPRRPNVARRRSDERRTNHHAIATRRQEPPPREPVALVKSLCRRQQTPDPLDRSPCDSHARNCSLDVSALVDIDSPPRPLRPNPIHTMPSPIALSPHPTSNYSPLSEKTAE